MSKKLTAYSNIYNPVHKKSDTDFLCRFPGTQEETRTPTACAIRTSSVLVYHSNTWACYTFRKQPEQTLELILKQSG